ncbi:MAG TPA: AGE family epimerase/isomerase [Thermomicrobiales bacterium]|jgi:mannose/cellobiose epimerase-like protein (N-acyl-D-glucosamine 2-epimerase family)|nr:AGE family epimerase/isomerase [Thermomicrobiales bacterium]
MRRDVVSIVPGDLSNHGPDFGVPAFLRQQASDLIDFYLPRSVDRATGGFIAQIADDGSIFDPLTRHLVGSCRYTNSFALGDQYALGAGCRAAAEHGLAFLREAHRDPVHGGYFWVLSGREPIDRRKFAYGHAFVLLTAATAIASGIQARDLLEDVSEVLETQFWRAVDGLYVDEISEDWSLVDPYRGQNANMHMVEALLAAYGATAESLYLDRAEIVARRVTVDLPQQTGGLLWEHFDENWRADLEYNKAAPHHLIRPYGVLSGHLLEWAKLLVLLERERPNDWAMPAARRFFAEAVDHAWDADEGGFLYAFDLDGAIVDDDKYHWTISEAIGSAVAMLGQTHDETYRTWYDRSWDYAWNHQIDRARGGWYPALTRDGQRKEVDFARGKPDFYHPLGACLLALDVFGGGRAWGSP